jgi:hypothetical protein
MENSLSLLVAQPTSAAFFCELFVFLALAIFFGGCQVPLTASAGTTSVTGLVRRGDDSEA